MVLNELDIEPAIAVDTHVFRVAHRLKLSNGKTPDQVEARPDGASCPSAGLTRAHHWLILHGRYVCVARKPKCAACMVADLCPSRELFHGRRRGAQRPDHLAFTPGVLYVARSPTTRTAS